MTEYTVECPCCGKCIVIQLSDCATASAVLLNNSTDQMIAKLSAVGLEFG